LKKPIVLNLIVITTPHQRDFEYQILLTHTEESWSILKWVILSHINEYKLKYNELLTIKSLLFKKKEELSTFFYLKNGVFFVILNIIKVCILDWSIINYQTSIIIKTNLASYHYFLMMRLHEESLFFTTTIIFYINFEKIIKNPKSWKIIISFCEVVKITVNYLEKIYIEKMIK